MTSVPPPPQHPSLASGDTASTTTGHTASTATHDATSSSAPATNNIGGEVGARAKGFFSAIHGAGEAIRGTINQTIDGLGDGVAGRNHGEVQSVSSKGSSEQVAQNGVNEFKQGYAGLASGAGGTTKPAV
ncbi:hypothetical protein P7C70_g8607, partial [Phenoliferia sp. Uapishka_3]